jgi:hypothetical protein
MLHGRKQARQQEGMLIERQVLGIGLVNGKINVARGSVVVFPGYSGKPTHLLSVGLGSQVFNSHDRYSLPLHLLLPRELKSFLIYEAFPAELETEKLEIGGVYSKRLNAA